MFEGESSMSSSAAIEDLLSSLSSEEELRSLQFLHSHLSIHAENNVFPSMTGDDDDDLFQNELLGIDITGDNPYPHYSPQDVCRDQEQLNRLTCYMFDRRFGWSETNTEDGRQLRRLSSTGLTLRTHDELQKTTVNQYLDSLIKWYLHQDLCVPLLMAMKHTLGKANHLPVVRNRTVIHIMDWLKKHSEQLEDNTIFSLIKDLIVTSLADVWSAIRNACSNRLGHISACFTLECSERLFSILVQLCCGDSPWQTKEGAIMGINAILQRFHSRAYVKSPLSSPRSLEGDQEAYSVDRIPEFVSRHIHSVVFKLLSHSQLTIREHAAKALASYITCSHIKDALKTLKEVVAVLRNGVQFSTLDKQHKKCPVSFLDDYAAEGFLGVCVFLVKVLPLSYLLQDWPDYVSTFLLYISHPASTVRQAASSVFKYLVVKSSHSVVMLKLILQGLTQDWKPDVGVIPGQDSRKPLQQNRPSVSDKSGCHITDTWEAREGRMFAYELIFKYLIKNHWLYTFGPAGPVGSHTDMSTASSDSDMMSCQKATESSDKQTQSRPGYYPADPMPHIESEKSLAVRFLTQTELAEDEQNSKRKGLERLMTFEETPEKNSSLNRYSPMNHGISQNAPGQLDTIYSLLIQAKIVDDSASENIQEIQHQSVRKIAEQNKLCCCKCEWLEKTTLKKMTSILETILYQTAECLADDQWELRRIANQVIPSLGEVIRWYDISLLENLWNNHLHGSSPLMTFLAVLTLKESLVHAVRLIPLINRPPSTWQDHDRCKDCLSHIVSRVQLHLRHHLVDMDGLLQRTARYDKLSIFAADVILVSHEHFNVPQEQKNVEARNLLTFWKNLFFLAHPHTRITTELQETDNKATFDSPFEGYLSCCLVKPDNNVQCAKQVDKQFVYELHHRLQAFLHSQPVPQIIPAIPLLGHYIGLFVDESHICKALIECLSSLCGCVLEYVRSVTDKQAKHTCLKCIHLTLKELSAVITMKSFDMPLVQRVLSIYEDLCKPVSPSRHLRVILTAISARVNESVQFTVEHSPRYQPEDLCLLSNDIPTSFSPELEEDFDSEEVIVGTPSSNRFPESLTLNTSNNSGSFLSGRLSALSSHSNDAGPSHTPRESQGSEEDGSDWDSWDEEEESDACNEVFSDFLKRLQKSIYIGKRNDFMKEVAKLGVHEKTAITELLKC